MLQLLLRTSFYSMVPTCLVGAAEPDYRDGRNKQQTMEQKEKRKKRRLNILQHKSWNSAQPLWRHGPGKALHCRIPRARKLIFASSRCQSEKSSNWTSAPATDFQYHRQIQSE